MVNRQPSFLLVDINSLLCMTSINIDLLLAVGFDIFLFRLLILCIGQLSSPWSYYTYLITYICVCVTIFGDKTWYMGKGTSRQQMKFSEHFCKTYQKRAQNKTQLAFLTIGWKIYGSFSFHIFIHIWHSIIVTKEG